MNPTEESKSSKVTGHYDTNYGNFQKELYGEIRREAFREDIGQNSWLTATEQDQFLTWLELGAGKTLLDVACGSGGPALRIAAATGCSIVGIDLHDQAICTAKSLAAQRNQEEHSQFLVVNATEKLPFPDATFDAITCIDAINHLPDRPRVIAEWARLLKPGGHLLFTDPITVRAFDAPGDRDAQLNWFFLVCSARLRRRCYSALRLAVVGVQRCDREHGRSR